MVRPIESVQATTAYATLLAERAGVNITEHELARVPLGAPGHPGTPLHRRKSLGAV